MGDAARRFLASMELTYERWREGDSYDLEAIDALSDDDRPTIEVVLLNHTPRDWRDIEALARLGTPAALAEVNAAARAPDAEVRRVARKHATSLPPDRERERLLIASLETAEFYGGLSEALAEACEFHPPGVIAALLRGARDRIPQVAVHCAAHLFYLHGKSDQPFDWNHRPFFLRFAVPVGEARLAAFNELCAVIGVDPASVPARG